VQARCRRHQSGEHYARSEYPTHFPPILAQKLTTKWVHGSAQPPPTHPPTSQKENFGFEGHGKEEFHSNRPSDRSEELGIAYPGTKRSTRFQGSGVQGRGVFADACKVGGIWIEVAPCSRGRRRAVASRAVPTGARWLAERGWTRSVWLANGPGLPVRSRTKHAACGPR